MPKAGVKPVFISYARGSTQPEAHALHHALGGESGVAFLDTAAIEPGAPFPQRLVNAILEATCVVIFADATYFQRRFCLTEWHLALAPYATRQGEASEQATRQTLAGIIIVIPPAGLEAPELDRLPPLIRQTNIPVSRDTESVTALVRAALHQSATPIRDRFSSSATATSVVERVLEASALPLPQSLRGLPVVPVDLVPSLGDEFVGRADDLWRIHDAFFSSGRDTFPIVSLVGPGGIGKTRLALEYLHRFGPTSFPGGLFWIDVDADETVLEERLFRILLSMRPDAPALDVLRASGLNVRDELEEAIHETSSNRPILVAVDHVPQSAPGANQVLQKWCPGIGKVALLTMSRASYLGVERVLRFHIQPLPHRSATHLLTAGLPVAATAESWREVAEWVGRSPVFLELLNRALRTGHLSPASLRQLASAKGPASELDRLADQLGAVTGTAVRGPTAVFEALYDSLSPEGRRAALLLCHLAAAPIPDELADAVLAREELAAARSELRTSGFISETSGANEVPTYGQMHRVLADFLRGKLQETATDTRPVAEAIRALVSPERCRNPADWPLLQACLPHAEAVLEHGSWIDERTKILFRMSLGLFMSNRGFFARAQAFEEGAHARALGVLGRHDPVTLAAGLNLAATCRSSGEFDRALALGQEVVQQSTATLGDDDPLTLSALDNVASTRLAKGELHQAEEIYGKVLDARRRLLGNSHDATIASMNNLAVTLGRLGARRGASRLHREAFDIQDRRFGRDHLGTLVAMDNLSRTLLDVGEVDEAHQLSEDVLARRFRILGDQHPATLTAMGNLASILRARNEMGEARKLEERVLASTREALGEAHPDTLTAKNNLAITLGRMGEVAPARRLQQEVLATRLKTLGKAHPDTVGASRNLFRTLEVLGDSLAAAELSREFSVAWLMQELLEEVRREEDVLEERHTADRQQPGLQQAATAPAHDYPADYYGNAAADEQAAYKAILCHRVDDADTAQQIAQALLNDGIKCWLHDESASPGSPAHLQSSKRVQASTACVALIGAARQTEIEELLKVAGQRRRADPSYRIIGVILPEAGPYFAPVVPSAALPITNWVHLGTGLGDIVALQNLIEVIKGRNEPWEIGVLSDDVQVIATSIREPVSVWAIAHALLQSQVDYEGHYDARESEQDPRRNGQMWLLEARRVFDRNRVRRLEAEHVIVALSSFDRRLYQQMAEDGHLGRCLDTLGDWKASLTRFGRALLAQASEGRQ